jgi:two-component system, OmpR family, sensor histidine kinase MprB
MILLAAGAVAAAVVLASVVVYVVTRDELIGQIDVSLQQKPQSVQFQTLGGAPRAVLAKRGSSGAASGSAQLSVRLAGATGLATAGVSTATGSTKAANGKPVKVEKKTVLAPPGTFAETSSAGKDARLVLAPPKLGAAAGYVQLYSRGLLLHSESKGLLLPVTAATRAVAAGRRGAFYSDVSVAGTPVRMLTERADSGGVWQVALPLGDLQSTLSHLRLVLALVCLGGVLLAAALGLLVSRAALVPVRRLRRATERVARTQDLGHRIDAADEDDELGRLAGSFNTMLAALERSRLAQRQLVSDASHELRTPLTSIQTNLDALAQAERLAPEERARVLAAVQAQLRELAVLSGDLIDLSKTEVEEIEIEDVRLDLATGAAVERARLHAPACSFQLDAQPCLVRAAPARLDRAIANLLDNACKWSPHGAPEEPIEVRVRDGVLEVRDHGPGIAEHDLPRVFDRFYRAPAARARPGSGLGLAIVRQVAESLGGTVHARNDPGGGARLALELAPLAMTDAELDACTAAAVGVVH